MADTAELAGRSDAFKTAVKESRQLKALPSQDQLLELYGYFKQATVGDVNTTRPGAFDFKGKYKWDKWAEYKGLSQDDADKKYVELVEHLKSTIGMQ